MTVAFARGGRKVVHQDRWSDGPRDLLPNKEPWTGFTFFKLENQDGNQDGAGQVPRCHVGENGSLPNVPTVQAPLGSTKTSSSTGTAAAELSALAAAAGSSSPTATAAAGLTAAAGSSSPMRWGYPRGDAAERGGRGRVVLSKDPQHPAAPEETSEEWSVMWSVM